MTNKILVLFLLISTFYSCSSDSDNSEINPTTPEVINTPLGTFNLTVDGKTVDFEQGAKVIRGEDSFILGMIGDNAKSFSINFHRKGNYGDINYTSDVEDASGFLLNYQSKYDYVGDHFDFKILSISDESVSGEFSGVLFDDDTLEKTIEVQGSFNLPVSSIEAPIPGEGLGVTINDQEWHSITQSTTISNNTETSLNHSNDTPYSLSILLGVDEPQEGEFIFNESTEIYSVRLSEFKSKDENPIEYPIVGNGILNIEEVTDLFLNYLIEGTFSFSAQNPENKEITQVKSIKFKQVIRK